MSPDAAEFINQIGRTEENLPDLVPGVLQIQRKSGHPRFPISLHNQNLAFLGSRRRLLREVASTRRRLSHRDEMLGSRV